MSKCVICLSDSTYYGLTHSNGNSVCLNCVTTIKEAYIKVSYPTLEREEVNV